jgi:hypothetical protein
MWCCTRSLNHRRRELVVESRFLTPPPLEACDAYEYDNEVRSKVEAEG